MSESVTLTQIVALINFGNVKAGTLGGFIQKTENLSQLGNCWVGDHAYVYDNARVTGGAIVRDKAIVRGRASVTDRVVVKDHALLNDHAFAYGDAEITGRSVVSGRVKISGRSLIICNAKVSGYGELRNIRLSGDDYYIGRGNS